MQRNCDACGVRYTAKRPNSRFCGDTCRKRGHRGAAATPLERGPEPLTGVVAATERELEAADRLDSALGQGALVLARRIESNRDTGAAMASLTREWRATLAEAVKDSRVAVDPLDEIARRRAARQAKGA